MPCEQPAYDPQLTALVARLMDQKRRQGMSGGMILQMTRVFALFVEATGVEDVRALRIYEGASDVQRLLIARELLRGPAGG